MGITMILEELGEALLILLAGSAVLLMFGNILNFVTSM